MNRTVNILIQVLLVGGIFGFLFWSAFNATDSEGKNVFAVLLEQPKRWHLLVVAFWIQFLAVVLVIIRWRWLLRTLGLQCSHGDAFRFGFFGMLVNIAPLGVVGGDASRAVLIALRNPNSRSQAVASVFIDRLIGLLTMFICGSALIYFTGFYARPEIFAQAFTHLIVALTAAGLLGTAIVFLPFFAKGHIERQLEKIPVCGKLLSKFVNALLMYRNHKRCLLKCTLLTIPVHFLCGMSLYFSAIALFPAGGEGTETLRLVPDWVTHTMLHCITNITTLLPLSAGPYELAFEQLYQVYGMSIGMGLIVSLMYRVIANCVVVAGVIGYYAISCFFMAVRYTDGMSEKTIFKRIIDKEIPAQIVYEDDLCMAFHDVNPQAPVHVLVIPKKEIASANQLTEDDSELLGHIFGVIRQLAKDLDLENGYRVITNCGNDGGQTVHHLHFHLLGGRKLVWPPG